MTGGTKESGASTPGDWTTANCYPTIALAWAALAADGDEVIINNEAWLLSAAVAGSAITVAGTVTVKSRSGNSTLCSIDCSSATVACFNLNKTITVTSYIFEGIGFRKAVTHTSNSTSVFIQASQASGDVTLRRCRFGDCTIAQTSNNQAGLVRNITSESARKLTLDACEFGGIATSNTGLGSYLGSTGSGHTLEIVNGLIIDGVSGSAIGFGGFYAQGPVVADSITARNIALSGSTINAVIYQHPNSASCNITSITGTDIAITGATCSAALLYLTKPFTLGDVVGLNVSVIASTETSGLGGLMVAVGSAAQGTLRSIDGKSCRGNYGALFYLSNGAGAIVKRAIANACISWMGMIYKGGDGDMTLDAYVCFDCEQIYPLSTEAENGGLVFYAHNGASSARASVTAVRSMTAAGNRTVSGLPAINIVNGDATYAVTVTLSNALLQNGLAHEIRVGSANVVNLNLNTVCMAGGNAAILNQTTGTYNETIVGTVNAAVTIDRSTYLPPAGSASQKAGTWIAGVRTINDLPLPYPPDIGAAQTERNSPAPSFGYLA